MGIRFSKDTEWISVKNIALWLFLLAFILRFAYSLFFYFFRSLPVTDLYYELAQQIVHQGKIFYTTDHPYYDFVGPSLPWINSLTFLIFGENWLGIYLVTSVVSALISLFTYKAALLVVDKPSALMAGLWSCFYPFYLKFSPTAGKDIWMALIFILLVFNLIKLFYLKEFTYPKFIFFIFLFVFSFHLDERFFVFTPFIFIYILISETSFFSKFRIGRSLLFGLLTIILMIPSLIRNYNKYNKIVIISTRTESLTDKALGYQSRGHPMDKFNNIYGAFYIHDYQLDSVRNGIKTSTDGGWRISEAQRQAMISGNLPKPFTRAEASWSRIKALLRPVQFGGVWERTGYYYYEKSLKHNIISMLFYGIMLIFSVPGFYLLYNKNQSVFYLFLSAIVIYTLIHALSIPYTNWRYRLPLDSLFIITGCYGLRNAIKRVFPKAVMH